MLSTGSGGCDLMTRFLRWYAGLPVRRQLHLGIVAFFATFGGVGLILAVLTLARSGSYALPIGIPIAMMTIGAAGAGTYLAIDRRSSR